MTIPPSLAQPSISQAPLEELDPNAINKSIIDAKGDLVTGTANDTPARLPVGTNGQVLIADSSQTTGLRWGTDPTSTIVDAKGDILVGTAADTLDRLPLGTNGQVLVVDTSTTTGVKWTSEADPTAITKSIIDAKGDLIVGTAPDTPARLPIGTNGQYLVANSSTTEGVAWTTPNIALGTETTGNYVAGITGGTGVTVTGSGTEGSTPTVAIGQDVGTGSTVAFGGLNVDSGTLYVDSTNNRVGINDTTPSYSLDVTGDANITTALTVGTTVTASDFVGDLSGILQIDVKNLSGGTLAAGTPVYISGTVGATQVAEVQASRADTPSTMPAIGLLETSLAANATGHAAVIGLVNNLNTSTYTLNAPLYVAPTGGLTNTRPTTSTDVVQVVGFAARLNTNTGAILATIYDQTRAPNAISIPGNITTTAGQFTGSGAGLTSIPAGQLTGTVPSAAIGNDSIALGTKTTGDYVQTVSAGTGVTVTGGTGEGSTPSIAIGQAVATTSTPQFAGLTLTGGANVTSISASSSVSANSLSSTTSISGASLTVDGIEIDTTGATANQVLAYDGTKFAPTSSGQLSSLIVSANSSTNAVRITQTGAGNALVVEDSTNPDSTPFVVTADGKVLVGNTTDLGNASMTIFSDSSLGLTLRDSGSTGGRIIAQRSQGTVASPTAVASGSVLGQLRADGYDGTNYVQSSAISMICDATPTSGSVNGRITFFTSVGGSSTERMRIDSAGRVTIGSSGGTAGRQLLVSQMLSGSTNTSGVFVSSQIQSDSTTSASGFRTALATAAQVFTVGSMYHFYAGMGTFGAGSVITNQIGFYASALSGATTLNIGFSGDLTSATGRYNLYMGGSAANYLAGRLGIGATLTSGAMARVVNTTAADDVFVIKGAASQTGSYFEVLNSADTVLSVLDSSNRLIIGHSSSITSTSSNTAPLQTHSTSTTQMGLSSNMWAANATGVLVHLSKSRGASIGTRGSVVDGDELGSMVFDADDGTNFITGAMIRATVNGTPGTNVMPTSLRFYTNSGGSSVTERMRIDYGGNFYFNMSTSHGAKVIAIGNGTAPGSNPTGGGYLYVESGALKYRGSSGTITTIANA